MIWCWWCCHPYDTIPLQMPYKYDDRKKTFDTAGNFCSWSCMKAHNMTTSAAHKKNIISANMVLMRKQVFGIVGSIPVAPCKYSLKVFGGYMTIEEFRKGLIHDHGPINKDVVDDISIIIKESRINIPATNYIKMSQISSSSGINEPLRLKRTKPLKRDDNNLEKTLGITRKKTNQ